MKITFCKIILILILLVYFTGKAKANEIESDFEYYNISYDFLNSNEYYVTYKFKPSEHSLGKYYLDDENVYFDTIEHNIDDFEQNESANDLYVDMSFNLSESREYFIRYKGFFNGKKIKKNGLSVKIFSRYKSNNYFDNSNKASISSFELRIENPEKIDLTKDKIQGVNNMNLKEEEGLFVFTAGDKYEKSNYKNITIYKEIVFKSDIEHQKKVREIIYIALVLIFVIAFAIVYNKKIKEQIEGVK